MTGYAMQRNARSSLKVGILLLPLLLASGCQNYSLVDGTRVSVKDGCSVEPQRKWNKATRSTFGNSTRTEVWTADGEQLDMIAFFCGVRDGEPVFAARSTAPDGTTREEQEQPFIYRKGMSANEIMDLFESGLGKVTQSAILRTRDLRPAKLGGLDGFRFEISFSQTDEVDREGTVIGASSGDRLYLIFFEGTRLYHYGKYLPAVEAMINTAQLPQS
jgi:hypothetical protein